MIKSSITVFPALWCWLASVAHSCKWPGSTNRDKGHCQRGAVSTRASPTGNTLAFTVLLSAKIKKNTSCFVVLRRGWMQGYRCEFWQSNWVKICQTWISSVYYMQCCMITVVSSSQNNSLPLLSASVWSFIIVFHWLESNKRSSQLSAYGLNYIPHDLLFIRLLGLGLFNWTSVEPTKPCYIFPKCSSSCSQYSSRTSIVSVV